MNSTKYSDDLKSFFEVTGNRIGCSTGCKGLERAYFPECMAKNFPEYSKAAASSPGFSRQSAIVYSRKQIFDCHAFVSTSKALKQETLVRMNEPDGRPAVSHRLDKKLLLRLFSGIALPPKPNCPPSTAEGNQRKGQAGPELQDGSASQRK